MTKLQLRQQENELAVSLLKVFGYPKANKKNITLLELSGAGFKCDYIMVEHDTGLEKIQFQFRKNDKGWTMNKFDYFVNGKKINGDLFAYDGCHKIYICEDFDDSKHAMDLGYEIHQVHELKKIYEKSCELRFISNWKLTKQYVEQFELATFA